MVYKTIDITLFVIAFSISFIGSIVGGIAISIHFDLEGYLYLLIILPLMVLSFVVSQMLAKKNKGVQMLKDAIVVNKKKIQFDEIDQYHFNQQAIGSETLELKLKSGQEFQAMMYTKSMKTFKKQFETTLNNYLVGNNESKTETPYLEYHKEQESMLRPVRLTLLTIVLIVDIVFLIKFIYSPKGIPYQFYLMNIIAISMIPFVLIKLKNKN